jgi:hypothetical protein
LGIQKEDIRGVWLVGYGPSVTRKTVLPWTVYEFQSFRRAHFVSEKVFVLGALLSEAEACINGALIVFLAKMSMRRN